MPRYWQRAGCGCNTNHTIGGFTMPLFEVAIVEEPTKKEREEEGKQERLVYFTPMPIVAKDSHEASIEAYLACTEPIEKQRMKVYVRPF